MFSGLAQQCNLFPAIQMNTNTAGCCVQIDLLSEANYGACVTGLSLVL